MTVTDQTADAQDMDWGYVLHRQGIEVISLLHENIGPVVDWSTHPNTAFNDHPGAWSSLAPPTGHAARRPHPGPDRSRPGPSRCQSHTPRHGHGPPPASRQPFLSRSPALTCSTTDHVRRTPPSWNLTPTSSSVPARNTASSPPSPPPSLRTSPTGSCSASSSNPYPTNLGCSGSANPSTRASAAPGRPCTTCAARDTPCRPTSLSTPPPLPTHHGPPRRTALWSAAAVLHRPPSAGRHNGVPRPPPRHRRPGRSHRSPPTHRPST